MRLRPQIAHVYTKAGVPLGAVGGAAGETAIEWMGKRMGLDHGAVAKTFQTGMMGAWPEPLADHREKEGCGGQ